MDSCWVETVKLHLQCSGNDSDSNILSNRVDLFFYFFPYSVMLVEVFQLYCVIEVQKLLIPHYAMRRNSCRKERGENLSLDKHGNQLCQSLHRSHKVDRASFFVLSTHQTAGKKKNGALSMAKTTDLLLNDHFFFSVNKKLRLQ